MHIFLNFKKDLCILGLVLTLKPISKVFLTHCFHCLKILSHFIVVTSKLIFSFLSFCLTGLNEFFLNFESNLCLKINDLRNEPFNGYAIFVEFVDVTTVCLCVFACVEFEKNA